MPAKSKKQQKLFGMMLAVKRGKVSKSKVKSPAKKHMMDMPEETMEEFAGTKRKELPEKVSSKESVKKTLRKIRRTKK